MREWWFLSKEGSQVGPVSFEELQTQARAGRLGPNDLVWSPSQGEWRQAIEIEDLFPAPETVGGQAVPGGVRGADPYGAGPYGAVEGAPRSLGELGLTLLRRLGKSLPRRIAFSVVLFVVVWLVHTVVMVFLNDGWGKVGNWFLGMILVVQGGEVGGTFFWMLLMMLVTVLVTRLRREGVQKFKQDIGGLGRAVSWAFSLPGRWGLAMMFGSAALTLLISFLVFAIWKPYTPNRLVSLFFAALLLLSLSSGASGLVLLVSRLGWFDFQRLFGVKTIRPFQPQKVILGVVGMAGGALLATVLPFLPTSGWFAVLALVVIGAIMTAFGGRDVPMGGFILLGAVVSVAAGLMVADRCLAHDWGWHESGRDLGRLIRSPGFGRATAHSMAAAIAAVLGALLPGAAAGVAGVAPHPSTQTSHGEETPKHDPQHGHEPEIPGAGPALYGSPMDNPYTVFETKRTSCGRGRPGLPEFFINTAILNMVIQDTIYRWSGLGPPVDLTLTYNSGGAVERGCFGFGWSFAYEWWLICHDSGVTVCKGSGQREEFTLPNGATSAAGSQELLPAAGGANRLLDRGDHWEYVRKGLRLRYCFEEVPGTRTARLTRVMDLHGNALAFEYDDRGFLRMLVDAAGRAVSFRYGDTGYCTGFLLPDGREASFGYDENGNLVHTVDLLGVVCEYSYDGDHCITQMVVGRERRTTVFGYQGTGARKRVASVTDARGNQTRYQLMATDPVEVKATRPGGRGTLYTSRNGLTERITDPLGHYEETVFRGGLPVAYKNKNGEITEADWDEHGNVVEVRGADGSVAHYQYDAESNLVGAVGPQGESWAFTYNEQRGLTTITSPLQTVITYTYDPSGRLIALSHSFGGQTSLSYDRFGNVERTTDPQGYVTSLVYDEWGLRLMSSTDVLNRSGFPGGSNL